MKSNFKPLCACVFSLLIAVPAFCGTGDAPAIASAGKLAGSTGPRASLPELDMRKAVPAEQASVARVFEDDMDRASLLSAYRMNVKYISGKDKDASVRIGSTVVTMERVLATLNHLIALFESDRDMKEISAVINANYDVYAAKGKGLITGYYEAEYKVSAAKEGDYNSPVLSTKRGGDSYLPLAYASAKDLAALKLEGSGLLVFTDGTVRRVSMEERNPYRFKVLGEGNNMASAMRSDLVPGRSIAVDRRYIPLGLPVFIVSSKPVSDKNGRITGETPFSRFVAAHDTGGAIKGPARIDLFFGSGVKNVAEGRNMRNNKSSVMLLVLKPEAFSALSKP